jgi:hypothetical protein
LSLTASGNNFSGDSFELIYISSCQSDGGALLREGHGTGAANALGGSGDEGDLALKGHQLSFS